MFLCGRIGIERKIKKIFIFLSKNRIIFDFFALYIVNGVKNAVFVRNGAAY